MACHQRKRIRKKIKVSDDEKISENRVLVTFSFSCPKVENFIFSFVWRFCPVSDGNLRKRIRKRGLRFRIRSRQAMPAETENAKKTENAKIA